METARGGKRIGAGRKKGLASIKAEEARKYTITRIAEELDPILTAQIEQAKGIYYEETDENGTRKVYQQLPDPRVGAFLLNQLIGSPKMTTEIEVKKPFSLIDLAKRAERYQQEQERKLIEDPKTPVTPYAEFLNDQKQISD